MTQVSASAQATVLTGERDEAVNTFDKPATVAPVSESASAIGTTFERRFAPRSLTVLRISGGGSSTQARP